jgi:hypothetical protein
MSNIVRSAVEMRYLIEIKAGSVVNNVFKLLKLEWADLIGVCGDER